MELKPSSVLAAAEADVIRYAINRDAALCDIQPYAFHKVHVHKAMRDSCGRGLDIIVQALKDLERGRSSGKRLTREIYKNENLLREAIGELKGRGNEVCITGHGSASDLVSAAESEAG